jgi:hypothetical protein
MDLQVRERDRVGRIKREDNATAKQVSLHRGEISDLIVRQID